MLYVHYVIAGGTRTGDVVVEDEGRARERLERDAAREPRPHVAGMMT